jgi:hypothetical protein
MATMIVEREPHDGQSACSAVNFTLDVAGLHARFRARLMLKR